MDERLPQEVESAFREINALIDAVQEGRRDRMFIHPAGRTEYPYSYGMLMEVTYPRPYAVRFRWPWQECFIAPRPEVSIPGGSAELVEEWTERLTEAWLRNGMRRPRPEDIPGTTDYRWWDRGVRR